MIERWFPCKEVSEQSVAGWGSGNQEKSLFPWFAARPTAQAKAAVLCSLLKWPDDAGEQARLQELVRSAMTGRYERYEALVAAIRDSSADVPSLLDPFSGRGMIPLEGARLGVSSYASDYSPVAVIASHLLTDFPFRDWSSEKPITLGPDPEMLPDSRTRLVSDLERVLLEIRQRHEASMLDYFPAVEGRRPWGYLWAVTLPCQECGNRFPLLASMILRRGSERKATKSRAAFSDPGQSLQLVIDPETSSLVVDVVEGPPQSQPTFQNASGKSGIKEKGKIATCPFCGHVHTKDVHRRLAAEGLGQDLLVAVVEPSDLVGRLFRPATEAEVAAAKRASADLATEAAFTPLIPAVPHESIALGNSDTIRPYLYGASTFGHFMCDRQTLSFVRLSRCISEAASQLRQDGLSDDYTRALTGYAASVLVRMLKFSTRGAKMRNTPGAGLIDHIFANEGTIAFSYDFFEVGLSDGPASWEMMAKGTLSTLRSLMDHAGGRPTIVSRSSATHLPVRSDSIAAVVTDPPYDEMIAYADASDLFYVWIKRALVNSWPELAVTSEPTGAQEKAEEAIVKRFRAKKTSDLRDHRTKEFYDAQILKSFQEMRRVVRDDGVVTIVFGHGEPEVWQRLLSAIHGAGLVMTGSWPANTEAGGQQGAANIRTTLTMACRPASQSRSTGRKGTVEAAIKAEIRSRYPDWERWGLAPTDMLMAAAGPAMEIVGQYSEVLDAKGEAVDISTFLPLARSAVQEAMAVEVDHHPLETFDARSRFALWWVRLFGREVAPKSELRWQTLAASLELADVRDLVPDADKGCQFVTSAKFKSAITSESAVIDVALALAAVSDQGREAMGQVLAESGRDAQDAYLWAAVKFLADRLPDSDPDSIAFNRVMRSRDGIATAAEAIGVAQVAAAQDRESEEKQAKLF